MYINVINNTHTHTLQICINILIIFLRALFTVCVFGLIYFMDITFGNYHICSITVHQFVQLPYLLQYKLIPDLRKFSQNTILNLFLHTTYD